MSFFYLPVVFAALTALSCSGEKVASVVICVDDSYLGEEVVLRTFSEEYTLVAPNGCHETLVPIENHLGVVDVDYGGMQNFALPLRSGDAVTLRFEAGEFYNFGRGLACDGASRACVLLTEFLELGKLTAKLQAVGDQQSAEEKIEATAIVHRRIDSLSNTFSSEESALLHNYIDKKISVALYRNLFTTHTPATVALITRQFEKAVSGTSDRPLYIDRWFWPMRRVVLTGAARRGLNNKVDLKTLLLSCEGDELESIVEALAILDWRLVNAGPTRDNERFLQQIDQRFGNTYPTLLARWRDKFEDLPRLAAIGDHELLDSNDQRLFLNELGGKVLYLDFWATWCAPCIAQHPSWNELHAQYEQEGITFLSISLDKNPEVWKRYLLSHEIAGLNFLVPGGFSADIAKIFNLTAIPRYVLLDGQLQVIDDKAPRPSDPAITVVLDSLLQTR